MRAGRARTILGAVGILAGVVALYVSRDGGNEHVAPSGDGVASTGEGADSPPRRAALAVVPDPAAEEIPGAHCWQGLLEIDRAGSLPELRDVLARALASGDELLATYVGDRLAEVVGGDVAKAAELLDWAEQAAGPEVEIVLGALARTAAVHDRAIGERLLRAGEDRGGDDTRRTAAVAALETQRRLDADALARVTAMATSDPSSGVAWTATRTLGRVMKEDFTRTGAYEPYWDQLLAISARTKEPAVRILALEMPAYVDAVLGTKYIDELAAVLRDAPEREVREMAAFQLGLTEDSTRVLGVFRSAFPRERDVCVRWAMLRFSVRAGGSRALPLLEEMARTDRRFTDDVADFKRIYATGVEDFERVWLDKADHPACSADGEAHGQEGA
ncbi:MAG TPA: HEAT repeat domain-containing protein [Kofleriaceae bacterium]|nr:HEAT repeat domain-containing protein [Kofleriaceae bacterium]